ncbi:uncharacterized protein SCHCODRAFT_02639181 [Schizophyllum commune H4-8]|uniref:uncharacterized protein n=1 Tax=Schizophyllum commune (strain H4-8 / FGSC 9210) TaxID=578458 RepID=UPI00215FCF9B|nr:uncharacterized protein SCHCODRAFT_02639181 [Schizophyllum commune H4-8]KAI5887901.1 hypothetical protein SCHCODRAFT_02639181 [Schizophyllum commune H4-8]
MACKPPEVAALLDTSIGSNYALYAVRMHRRVVVFHARGLPAYAQYHSTKDPFRCISDDTTEKDHKDAQRQWVADLKVIQENLESICWEISPWVYLDRERREVIPRVISRNHRIRTPCWTELVDESEIFLTKFINAYHRQGICRGIPIEVFRGWNDDTLRDVERGMDAYQALKRADLLEYAHEIYGHMTSEDRVVGYVTEPMTGRIVQPRDKKLVYSAVARLHRAGLCYAGFHESNTLPSFSRSGLQTRLKRDVAQSGFCVSNLLIYGVQGGSSKDEGGRAEFMDDEGGRSEYMNDEDGAEFTDARVKFIDLAGIEPASEEGNRLDWESVERLFAESEEDMRNTCPSPCDAQESYIVIPSYPKCMDLRAFLPRSHPISPVTSQLREKRKQFSKALDENESSAGSQ